MKWGESALLIQKTDADNFFVDSKVIQTLEHFKYLYLNKNLSD